MASKGGASDFRRTSLDKRRLKKSRHAVAMGFLPNQLGATRHQGNFCVFCSESRTRPNEWLGRSNSARFSAMPLHHQTVRR